MNWMPDLSSTVVGTTNVVIAVSLVAVFGYVKLAKAATVMTHRGYD